LTCFYTRDFPQEPDLTPKYVEVSII